MNNDTIIEEMRIWTHSEIDKALDKARADERAKVLNEVDMILKEQLYAYVDGVNVRLSALL